MAGDAATSAEGTRLCTSARTWSCVSGCSSGCCSIARTRCVENRAEVRQGAAETALSAHVEQRPLHVTLGLGDRPCVALLELRLRGYSRHGRRLVCRQNAVSSDGMRSGGDSGVGAGECGTVSPQPTLAAVSAASSSSVLLCDAGMSQRPSWLVSGVIAG